jgi:hypothetical protein
MLPLSAAFLEGSSLRNHDASRSSRLDCPLDFNDFCSFCRAFRVNPLIFSRVHEKPISFFTMSTLADELLQDFEGSGSEAGGDEHDDGLFGEAGLSGDAQENGGDTAMEEVRDEDEDADEDADLMDGVDGNAAAGGDEEDAKTKIEKMQLGGVRDVRTVAVLMKTLTPVLEVSSVLS